jgi:hypothetical protein
LHIVTTVVLFLAGFSLAFSAVKVLTSLPGPLIRWTLYLLVLACYASMTIVSRNTDFASWFHFAWSIVLMVLVFGLLRKQSVHVCRWFLYLLSSAVLIPFLIAAAFVMHEQTDIWLHRGYIQTTPGQLFPALMLVAMPSGLAFGLVCVWIGVWKNRQTGHAIAAHWSWWSIVWTTGAFGLAGLCVVGNDWELRYRRDSILARANAIEKRIVELSPKRRSPPYYLTDLVDHMHQVRHKPDQALQFDKRSTGFLQHGEWMAKAEPVLTQLRELVDEGNWPELQMLPSWDIANLARLLLDSANYRSCLGDLEGAVLEIAHATDLIDRAITAEEGCILLSHFESERIAAVERLLNACDKTHSHLLAKILSKKPYENLRIGAPNVFQAEWQGITECRIALNDERQQRWESDRNTFFWRLMALRRTLPIAEEAISLSMPIQSRFAMSNSGSNYYADEQFARLFTNSAIRAAQHNFVEATEPSSRELFADDLDEDQRKTIGIISTSGGWAVWQKQDPQEGSDTTTQSPSELIGYLSGRRSVLVGPLYRERELRMASSDRTSERFEMFVSQAEFLTANSAFFALPIDAAYDLQCELSDDSVDYFSLSQCVANAAGTNRLNINDKWFEIGLCLLNNPSARWEIDGLQMAIPTTQFNYRYGHKSEHSVFLTFLSLKQMKQVAQSLQQLTDEELRTRYDTIASQAFNAVETFDLVRPLYSYTEVRKAVEQLRDFYGEAEQNGKAVLFCPNPEFDQEDSH